MSVRRPLTTALTCLAAAPLLMLAACGGDDTSIADPPISSAPTSSAPPEQQRESAEHFIRRWAAEDTRIQQTGETATFRAMSDGCRGCQRLADLVDRIYRDGGYIHTRGWTVKGVTTTGNGIFDLYVIAAPTNYAESADGVVHHLAPGPAQFQLRLARSGNSWVVTSLVQVSA